MSSVVRRTIRSTPYRDARETWELIITILTAGGAPEARTEMSSVTGIVASIIADHCPQNAPIIATCEGPRTRFYCLYDDDALEADTYNESGLSHDATKGDWRVSIPCQDEDLTWVQAALKEKTSRITARNEADDVTPEKSEKAEASEGLVLNLKGLLG
ncbi:hypothetical protein ABEV34_10580 [Methylorubrum rhodesianum]|uniref:hypothetical protein n=1 Tax=Methylorubrum rhodesianum TaxID=29427 RepID=UPI00161F69A2|nr:hypothetical protein [Methylorubrum rhodesianum]MBB5763356.1 hypothetical protein [Methylorubrum rhodesianum]MBI1691053.1 hypothetical protein [Methylorubrum sp. DB1722]